MSGILKGSMNPSQHSGIYENYLHPYEHNRIYGNRMPSTSERHDDWGRPTNEEIPENKELRYSSRYGDVDKVRKFLDDGASPNAHNTVGQCAPVLVTAAAWGYVDVMEVLLEHGADIYAVTTSDTDSVNAAAKFFHPDTLQFLLEHGSTLKNYIVHGQEITVLMKALSMIVPYTEHELDARILAVIEILLQFGVSPNGGITKDSSGGCSTRLLSPLTHVVKYPNSCMSIRSKIEACDILTRYGADKNEQGPGEKTALHYSMGSQHPKVISHLIEAGADVNIMDSLGEKPRVSLG